MNVQTFLENYTSNDLNLLNDSALIYLKTDFPKWCQDKKYFDFSFEEFKEIFEIEYCKNQERKPAPKKTSANIEKTGSSVKKESAKES